jgi:hypothetical protein
MERIAYSHRIGKNDCRSQCPYRKRIVQYMKYRMAYPRAHAYKDSHSAQEYIDAQVPG